VQSAIKKSTGNNLQYCILAVVAVELTKKLILVVIAEDYTGEKTINQFLLLKDEHSLKTAKLYIEHE